MNSHIETTYDTYINDFLLVGNPPRITNRKNDVQEVITEFDRIITTGRPRLEQIKKDFGNVGKEFFLAGEYKKAAEQYRYALELISDYIGEKVRQLPDGTYWKESMFVPLRKIGGSRTRRSKAARSTRRLRKRLH
jgi:hypothetical protein